MPDFYSKYGKKWSSEVHPLQVEMWAIRHPEWIAEQGRTLAFHFEEFRKLCWPHLDAHRWHLLCLEEITKNKVTVLMGPGSSGKTTAAAWIYLTEYWCFPNETCVLVSSTDMRGLRKRAWGEITDLWQKGIEKFDFLSGHLLDSALAITTDNIDDFEYGERKARNMRLGCFGIPCVQGGKFVGLSKFVGIKQKRMRLIADEACFPIGTLVDTPDGKRPIETIKLGDSVLNCNGIGKVTGTSRKRSTRLVHIQTADGREIVCTPTHPLFTREGWKTALHVNQSDVMVDTYEAMHLMRYGVSTQRHEFSPMRSVSGEGEGGNLHPVWWNTSQSVPESEEEVLRSLLRVEASAFRPGIPKEVLHREAVEQNFIYQKEKRLSQSRSLSRVKEKTCSGDGTLHGFAFGGAKVAATGAHECDSQAHWAQAEGAWRQWNWDDSGREGFESSRSRNGVELSYKDQAAVRERLPKLLQGGLCRTGIDVVRGGRRTLSQIDGASCSGREENCVSDGNRVVAVKIYEQEDFRGYKLSGNGIEVCNLEIEGHPSYSVNGFLVHNSMMGESFLSAFANLNKNEDFRAIVLGNPNDPIDPLGRAAEPAEGWTDAYMEPGKTRVWNTRFMSGRCVNLIGTDSPNFDFPEDKPTRFKYLISREKIADTLSFFPKDSLEYYSQCIGSMKIGTMSRRVLTRKMCIENKALEKVIWKTSPTTRVYFVDASYGGDLCVGGSADIGEDIDGKNIISFNEPKVIPIKVGTQDMDAEYQIANFVKADLERQEIPPDCMGHDSTGRGALGTALSKVLGSADTHPIESGGAPSDRPVSADLYVTDEENGQRRLKLCSEHYDRKVSEFWYQVRYAVESGQLRNLPEECLSDLCTRKWDRIKRDIISVEPKNRPSTDPNKQGMKQRTGKSPDHGDWAAGIVEMARRKGFIIDKLGKEDGKKKNKPTWIDDLYKETQEAIKSTQLQEA